MNPDAIPTPRPYVRSVEEIDDDLASYAVRERRQRELLLGSLEMLDAISRRREVLLDQRLEAAARARSTPSAG